MKGLALCHAITAHSAIYRIVFTQEALYAQWEAFTLTSV